MKPQKMKDIRELSVAELQQKTQETEEEMFKLRLQLASRQLADPSKIRVLRRNKARYLTLIKDKGVQSIPATPTKTQKTLATKEK